MQKITEIFILKMKDPKRAEVVREAARADFLSVDGVEAWKTYVTTAKDRPTLFAEIYEFPDHETAKRVTPTFATRDATKAFLAEIDEIIVGQYFTELTPTGDNK
ncbi:hypothetical protein [Kordiimonas aquimaris]|uniref:hypothetical protein n=1 Tax=Kordiimonas aquimaris TaxID=707591 RepID=UPI0021D2389A|nr:hypothetical protein [Kordiimonas aquimaris]